MEDSPVKMRLAAGLNACLRFDDVCNALRIPLPARSLPARTRCPLCGKDALGIFNDNTAGGQWHQCAACGHAGDLIELAAATWKTHPGAALRQLASAGIPLPDGCLEEGTVDAYVRGVAGYQASLRKLWSEATANYPRSDSAAVIHLREKFALHLHISPERWKAGPGRMLGVMDPKEAEAALHPFSYLTPPGSMAEKQRKKVEIFRGRKWGDVLATPFYDMPGHIRGFGFVGRGGDSHADKVFQATTPIHASHFREAGLALADAPAMAGNPGHVVAADDWMFALQVQFRHFRTSLKPLSLVAWHDDGVSRTRAAWDMFSDKRIILWAMVMDHRLISQAVACDGEISMTGPVTPTHHHIRHYLRNHPHDSLERLIIRNAQPWPQALRQWQMFAAEGEVSEMYSRLEQKGEDISTIFRRLGRGLALPRTVKPCVLFQDRRIIEKSDEWHAEKAVSTKKPVSVRVMNATLRLLAAVKDSRSGEVYYKGIACCNGNEVPFLEKVTLVRDQTFKWLERLLIDHGAGILSVEPKYRRHLHAIANLFHVPEIVTGQLYKWVEQLREEQKK